MEKQIMIWCDRECYWNIDGKSCVLYSYGDIHIDSEGKCISQEPKRKPNLKPELRWWEKHVVEEERRTNNMRTLWKHS